MKERDILGTWNPLVEAAIGIAYIRMDKREKTQELLDHLIVESNKAYVPPTCLASLYFVLGKNDQGFNLLNKAYEENDSWMGYLKIDHAYDNIRSDPRYIDLLKKIGFK